MTLTYAASANSGVNCASVVPVRLSTITIGASVRLPFSENAFQVLQNGMDALEEAERNEYVSDFKGFVTYVRTKGFQKYADEVNAASVVFVLGEIKYY